MSMYCFLIASLPELEPDVPAPLSVAAFDALVGAELDEELLRRLTAFDGVSAPGFVPGAGLAGTYVKYGRFEEYLRNRIAHRRADGRGTALELSDPPEYFSAADGALSAAAAATDPESREKLIDAARWSFLDELELGHDFDFERLCVYRLKLGIVNKYLHRAPEPGRRNFDALLDRISPAPER